MSRPKRIELSILNVNATPHPEGVYRDLLEASLGLAVRSHGAERAVIADIYEGTEHELPDILWGHVFFYTEIEREGDWLDWVAMGQASERQVEEISIPEDLKPNLKIMRYFFDLRNHHFYFERRNDKGQNFTANKIKGTIERIFSHEELRVRFPEINVTLVPTEDAIEHVLEVPNLQLLVIHLERPNPDDIGSDARRLMEKLEGQGAIVQDTVLKKSKTAERLEPDEDTTTLANVAASHGWVSSKGKSDDGVTQDRNTKHYPKKIDLSVADGSDALESLFAYFRGENDAT